MALTRIIGSKNARYSIRGTGLPGPHAGAFLEKVSITGGKFVTGGATFAIGVNNVPPHFVREGYIPKLIRLEEKYVVLWDEEVKQGWLVNGTSALLHLVRGALNRYQEGSFASELLFDENHMEHGIEHHPASAVKVLINRHNRGLEIWPGRIEISEEAEIKTKAGSAGREESNAWKRRRGFTLFEDLVEQQYTILDLMMQHHKLLAGQNGINLKLRARKHLEGWDFNELATGRDPRPRIATLHALRYGWVDFVRSIEAITLFGSGFGDLIQPKKTDTMCPQWSTLPKGEYHLAASMYDLNRIMEAYGNKTVGGVEAAEGLIWHSPHDPFAHCRCLGRNTFSRRFKSAGTHHNPVQVFCPKRSKIFSKVRTPGNMGDSGAVVFGHNISWPYRWKETKSKDDAEDVLEQVSPGTISLTTSQHSVSDRESSGISSAPSEDSSKRPDTASQSSRSHHTTLTSPDSSADRSIAHPSVGGSGPLDCRNKPDSTDTSLDYTPVTRVTTAETRSDIRDSAIPRNFDRSRAIVSQPAAVGPFSIPDRSKKLRRERRRIGNDT